MTTPAKHTPGPWGLFQNAWNLGVYDARGALVADLLGNLVPNAEGRDANAHLIAAAPALLDSLSDIIDYLLAEPTQTVVPDGRIRDARTAITEAKKQE